ncbi:MAG: hypothetical protein ABI823_07595 [Bryobacteraceae bacterium]
MIDIDLEHPEYRVSKSTWKQYRDLYAGGEALKSRASEYLVRRQREPGDVYNERVGRAFYENYIGSIVDWYGATLFRREPVLAFDGRSDAGRAFFSEMISDCDLRGTNLADFFRRQFVTALVTGASYVLVDFPRISGRPANRAQEDAIGASRAYLVEYGPEDLINWSHDERGNFEWVVLRTKSLRKENPEDAVWVEETRWSYFDKTTFRHYRRMGAGTGDSAAIELVAEGSHGLAKQNRVPLFETQLPEGLWLTNRAGLLQLEHFNKSNALAWALTMGLFAMPVIYSDREWTQMVGESYYIQLGPEDKFGWTEPEGKVFQIAADNLERLKGEIYRVCYVAHMGGPIAGSRPESGLSKQRDFSVTQEVLRAYGDSMKDHMRRVLQAVNDAREDGLKVGVTGMDEFDIGDFGTELDDAERILKMGIGSGTLKKEIFKRLALKFLCDVGQEVKEKIAAEIESAA